MKELGNTAAEKILLKAYIAVESILLLAIQTVRLVDPAHMGTYMYAAIIINTLVAAYFYARYGRALRDRHDNLIAYALFMTLIADWFLTFVDVKAGEMTYVYGLAAFCTVEILYATYLRVGPASIIARLLLYAAALFALHKAGMLTAESALGALNMILISANVIDAWVARRRDTALIFRLGITLFLCCDITVMLTVLTSGWVSKSIGFMTWIFYVPAQVLLTLSYVKACSKRD